MFRVRVQIHIQGLRLGFRVSVQGKRSVLLLGFVLKCTYFSLGSGLQDPFQGLSSGLGFGFGFRALVYQFLGLRFGAQIRIQFRIRFRVRLRVKL